MALCAAKRDFLEEESQSYWQFRLATVTEIKGFILPARIKPKETWMGIVVKKVEVYLKKWRQAQRHR